MSEGGPRIAVVGLGNVLMADDGFGPYVVRVLEATYEFPSGVALLDAGTPGLDLVPFLEGLDALIVVDTVRADGSPGTMHTYRREEILRHAAGPRTSPHDPGLKETLWTLEFVGRAPRDVLLVGVVPGPLVTDPHLSTAVRDAVPRAVESVVAELERLGVPAPARTSPKSPGIWWEQ